jgi:signal peptidase I
MNAGDMVIVNRMAYHFRKPERGETFVFDTRDIPTDSTKDMQDQTKASHYIKRLCGLPGDTLSIQSPHLLVNGKPAEESTIRRVAACQAPYNEKGYNLMAQPRRPETMNQSWYETKDILKYYQDRMDEYNKMYLSESKPTVTLNSDSNSPNLREYAAFGDNTVNSKDSRYWGPVRQYNVLGPAVMTIWPFTSHWGSIE